MRILVTGASGLLGLNIALELAKHHKVYGLTNQRRVQTETFRVVQADLTEPDVIDRILEFSKPDWVINCAAFAEVDACEKDPKRARYINAEVPGKLATSVKKCGARLIHISTDAVFDGKRGDYIETDTPNPLNVYARTKLEGEQAVASADPKAIIARTDIFGWSLTGRRSLCEFFFYNLMNGKGVNGFTDAFFSPLLVNHLAEIFGKMFERDLSGLYHVVSDESLSKYHFGVRLAKRFGLNTALIRPASITKNAFTAERASRLTLINEKLSKDLAGPLPNVSSGIEGLYKLNQQNYPLTLKGLAVDGYKAPDHIQGYDMTVH